MKAILIAAVAAIAMCSGAMAQAYDPNTGLWVMGPPQIHLPGMPPPPAPQVYPQGGFIQPAQPNYSFGGDCLLVPATGLRGPC